MEAQQEISNGEPMVTRDDVEETLTRLAWSKITTLEAQLDRRYHERHDVITGMLAALIAGEHVLLLGEPGVAKSALAHSLCDSLSGNYFSLLLSRYTTPDELFGPVSLKALQEDRFERRWTGRLPEAHVAFLDEVFRGNSATLNALLRAINERVVEQDGAPTKIPLRLVVAAANALPDDEDGLQAFHDRFLVRFQVDRLQDDRSVRTMLFGDAKDEIDQRVDHEDLDRLRDAAKRLPLAKDAQDAIVNIRTQVAEKGVRVSDRRWKHAVGYLRADAIIRQRKKITSADLACLEHCLWERPEQRITVREVVRANVAAWIRQIQDAHAALDEQMARAREAAKPGHKGERTKQLGMAVHALGEIDNTMVDLVKQNEEATDGALSVRKRIGEIKEVIKQGMADVGIKF